MHLRHDDFFQAIKSGFVQPWLPEARNQNQAVIHALCNAALAFSQAGYFVIVDGVLGGEHLGCFRALENTTIAYIVLRPGLQEVKHRAREREIGSIQEYPPLIYEAFTGLGSMEKHVLDSTSWGLETTLKRVRAACQDEFYLLSS